MATSPSRQKLVVSNAINMLVEINQIIVENARKGQSAKIVLPTMFNRAFMIVHEAGIVPIIDTLDQ